MIASSASYLQHNSVTAKPVKVVLYKNDQTYTLYEATLSPEQDVVEVRVSDVPVITTGDSFSINDKTYIAVSEPVALMNNAVWRVGVRSV